MSGGGSNVYEVEINVDDRWVSLFICADALRVEGAALICTARTRIPVVVETGAPVELKKVYSAGQWIERKRRNALATLCEDQARALGLEAEWSMVRAEMAKEGRRTARRIMKHR